MDSRKYLLIANEKLLKRREQKYEEEGEKKTKTITITKNTKLGEIQIYKEKLNCVIP